MDHTGKEDRRKRFATAIASVDGNVELLRELGPGIAERYGVNAGLLTDYADSGNLPAIENLAHQARSTWALYGSSEPDLPERLELAARHGDAQTAIPLARRFSGLMQATSNDLHRWLDPDQERRKEFLEKD